jgi:DNA-binding response OmpR family regulator
MHSTVPKDHRSQCELPLGAASTGVVVVDDDKEFAEFLRSALAVAGFSARVVRSVADARRCLRNNPRPALIVAAVVTRSGLGFELLWREHAGVAQVPVILMTDVASPELREFVAVMGTLLLEKPFTAEQLHAAVDAALSPRMHGPTEVC